MLLKKIWGYFLALSNTVFLKYGQLYFSKAPNSISEITPNFGANATQWRLRQNSYFVPSNSNPALVPPKNNKIMIIKNMHFLSLVQFVAIYAFFGGPIRTENLR